MAGRDDACASYDSSYYLKFAFFYTLSYSSRTNTNTTTTLVINL